MPLYGSRNSFFAFVLLPALLGTIATAYRLGHRPRGVLNLSASEVDFGVVAAGSIHQATVIVHNRGAQPLTFNEVGVSCGCTTTNSLPRLSPGESAPLQIRLDTTGFAGAVEKQVRVAPREHSDQMVTVTLRAQIEERLRVAPSRLDFGTLPPGHKIETQVTLDRLDGRPLRVYGVPREGERTVTIQRPARSRVRLVVVQRAEGQPGAHLSQIRLKTDVPDLEEVRVPVVYRVRSPFAVVPDRINFGVVASNAHPRAIVRIHAPDATTSLRIVSLPQGITARLTRSAPSRWQIATEIYRKGGDASLIAAPIRLTTSDPKQKIIEIPIYAAIR